jgi:hypothetical protein
MVFERKDTPCQQGRKISQKLPKIKENYFFHKLSKLNKRHPPAPSVRGRGSQLKVES